MVADFWRHGSLPALAATLLMAHQAAADPSLEATAKETQSTDPQATVQLDALASAQLDALASAQLDVLASAQLDALASAQRSPPAIAQLRPQATARGIPQATAPPSPLVTAQLSSQVTPRGTLPKVGNVLERVPTASWAMGCAAGIALAMHAVYQNSSDRHRIRMQSCADECPNYRVDHYKETRERADVALRLSVFAAASALWLVYNDPQEALERMGQRKPPREQPGFRVKVKPERRGVWASVVAYF